jgi:hypothetical protein
MTDTNPFTEIDQRLQRIESLLSRMKAPTVQIANPNPDMVDIVGASKILMTPVTTIYKKIRQIPHFRHGRNLIFKRDELIEWLNSHRQKTTSELEAEAIRNIQSKVRL